jgi:hypothetical protein
MPISTGERGTVRAAGGADHRARHHGHPSSDPDLRAAADLQRTMIDHAAGTDPHIASNHRARRHPRIRADRRCYAGPLHQHDGSSYHRVLSERPDATSAGIRIRRPFMPPDALLRVGAPEGGDAVAEGEELSSV